MVVLLARTQHTKLVVHNIGALQLVLLVGHLLAVEVEPSSLNQTTYLTCMRERIMRKEKKTNIVLKI